MHNILSTGRFGCHVGRRQRRRGMALLLVMVGMVICTILTAGFLASQGTSIGIARNQRDAVTCRAIAQSGIDMCYWQIRNKPDWRTTMPVGNWLDRHPVGDGVVSVSVADGDASGDFADDSSQPVILTSVGMFDNRSFTLTATIRPTGGGTVYGNGHFIHGTVVLGSGSTLAASIDSYNSALAAYDPLSPGSNAVVGSNALAAASLTIYSPSTFRGSYLAAPGSVLGDILNLIGEGATVPIAMSYAAEARNPGRAVPPNPTGLTYRGAFSRVNMVATTLNQPGRYDSFLIQSSNVTITASGLYYVTGNFSIPAIGSSTLTVANGVSAVFLIDGNVTINRPVQINGSGRLSFYCNGTVSVGTTNINTNLKNTARFLLVGAASASAITVTGNSNIYGAIYAPQASLLMQTNSPQIYGAIVARELHLRDGAKIHFDEALRDLYFPHVTDGSAPPGSADYHITINGGPGIGR